MNQKLLLEARKLAGLDFWELDDRSWELIINQEHLESLGYARQEGEWIRIPVQNYVKQIVHPDDAALLQQWLSGLKLNQVLPSEFRALGTDGKVRFFMAQAQCRADETHSVFGIFQDISFCKKAERALRENEVRYSLVLEATNSGVWDWNIQTGKLFNNASWARILGYAPEDLTGDMRMFEKCLEESDKAAVMERIAAHLRGDTAFYESTHRMRRQSGELVWVHDRGRVVEWDVNGRPLRMIGSLTDISDRIRMEQALRENEKVEKVINYFSTSLLGKNTVDEILWDVAGNCIHQLGFTDCVVYLVDEANQKLVQKAAYGQKRAGDFEVFQPIELPLGKGIVGHVALSGKAEIVSDTSVDSRYVVDDDRRLSEITVPIVYENRVIGVIDSEHAQKDFFTENHLRVLTTIASLCSNKVVKAIAEEQFKASLQENERLVREQNTLLELKIKERTAEIRQQNKQLSQLNTVKDKLLSIIAHDLRNPMNSLKGLLNLLQLEALSPEEFKACLLRLNSTLKSTGDLLDNLLTWATAQIQRTQLKMTVVPLHASVAENIELLQPFATEKNIQLINQLEPTDLALADESMVKLVLRNLLTNALKFTESDGCVSVSAYPEDTYIVVAVADTGIGITPEIQRKLFNISTKFTTYGTQQEKGSGLGLALCKEFVEKNGGRIWVESEPKKGSVFRFTLRKAPENGLPNGDQSATVNKRKSAHKVQMSRETI